MVKFSMIIVGAEDTVFMNTASSTMGSTDVGQHFVTFSGNGRLTSTDQALLKNLAAQVADAVTVDYQGEIVVGLIGR
jgi:hypothetical protein